MSASGLCGVCELAAAQFTCDRCGAAVCGKHYDAETGLCTACVGDATGERDVGRDDPLR